MGGPDGVARFRDGRLRRLMHVGGAPALVAVAQPAADRVAFAARAAGGAAAEEAIRRMRFALGVDDDLRPFHERFRWDPVIGPAVRRHPARRIFRRPDPFEALAWAITEQLIEFDRAADIQRRIVRRLGRRCPATGLRDLPAPAALAGQAPALLQSLGLSAGRSLALVRVAREVAAGRIDLECADQERGWRRLRAIPGIGRWTVEMLALRGQGRYDQVPAGDLHFLEVVGRLLTGNPHAYADEDEVRELLAPYHPWEGLAGSYLLGAAAAATIRAPRRAASSSPSPAPVNARQASNRRASATAA
jgi:3-methyladenine DNA glycosylase/8-oxoguanine DNA glycosylase